MANKDDIHNSTLTDLKHAAEHQYAIAKDKAIHLAHDASEKAAEAKQYIVEKSQKVKETAIKAEESVTTYVKENPWKAVGISAAIGIILGKLFRSGRK